MITIDCEQLYSILEQTPSQQNILLVGRHGIGKSEIIRQHYTERGLRVVSLFLGQMADPGDLIGLPSKQGEQTVFLPPTWFPLDGKPIVLFLDELNRARPELLQTVMDLCLSRQLAGRSLPEGSRIVAAVNDGDAYQLTPLDPALVSRFNVYQFVPSVQDWLTWAAKQGLDERVLGFIRLQPAWLDGVPGDKMTDHGLEPQPDRRAWYRLATVIHDMPRISEHTEALLCGIVGSAAVSRWMAYVSGEQLISAAQVLTDFVAYITILRSYPLHKLSQVNESLFQALEIPDLLPADKPTCAHNFAAYVEFLKQREDREALAHMANIFASGVYPHAVSFIVSDAPEVYTILVEYIADL